MNADTAHFKLHFSRLPHCTKKFRFQSASLMTRVVIQMGGVLVTPYQLTSDVLVTLNANSSQQIN